MVETRQQFCPDDGCSYYGWGGRGNIRAHGHPGGKPWQQFQCVSCPEYFQETHGTPLPGKRVSSDLFVWAVGAVAEGLGIRAVARVCEVDPKTVLQWLVAAADHLKAFSQYFLRDVRATQVQLDELSGLLRAVKDGAVSEAEALPRLSRSPHWVWAVIDPVSKLLLTIDVGERTRAMAQRVVHQVAQVLVPGCVPLFLTDGFTKKRREASAFMPGMDRRWARRAQCPRAQQYPRSARALNGRGHCIGGSTGIHAGEDVHGVCDRVTDPLWPLGPATTPPGHRSRAEAPLDATAPAPLCASDQDRAAPASGPGAPPHRLQHAGGDPAGAGGMRLADHYGVH
jgi:hypothetical protein